MQYARQYLKDMLATPLNAVLFPHPALWIALAIFAAIQPIWLYFSGLQINFDNAWQTSLLGCWMLYLGVRFQHDKPVVAVICFTASFTMLVGLVLKTLTYLGTAASFPLIDPWLAAFDRAVGFDWIAHTAWVNSQPWLVSMLAYIYIYIISSMMVTLAVLVLMRRFERIRELLLTNGLLSLLGVVFCTFFPAIGAYAYYNPDPALVANIPAEAGRYHLEHFNALRTGQMTAFGFNETLGIITFPSFHTIVPVLLVWSLRRTVAFWFALPIGALMVLSSLSMGGHHLADLIASAILCAAALAIYHWFERTGKMSKYSIKALQPEAGNGSSDNTHINPTETKA